VEKIKRILGIIILVGLRLVNAWFLGKNVITRKRKIAPIPVKITKILLRIRWVHYGTKNINKGKKQSLRR
jgi:hypothetical protein